MSGIAWHGWHGMHGIAGKSASATGEDWLSSMADASPTAPATDPAMWYAGGGTSCSCSDELDGSCGGGGML